MRPTVPGLWPCSSGCWPAMAATGPLMESADAMGVKYYVKSIGVVPVHSLAMRLQKILPVTEMDAAIALDVSWKQVRGASIGLIRNRRARWLRGKLVPLAVAPSADTAG